MAASAADRRAPLCSAFVDVPRTVTGCLVAGEDKLDIIPAVGMLARGFSFQVRVHAKTVGQDFCYVVELPEAPLSSGIVIEGSFERVLKIGTRDPPPREKRFRVTPTPSPDAVRPARFLLPDSPDVPATPTPPTGGRSRPSFAWYPTSSTSSTSSVTPYAAAFNFGSSGELREKLSTVLIREDAEGRLACFAFSVTEAFEGTVLAYAAPVAPGPVVADLTYGAMRSRRLLTDVLLRAAGEEFPAHRLVLATASPVFRSMFSGGYKESREEVVDIVDVASAPVFLAFLDYMYSGSLGALSGPLAVVDLLELADRYLLDNLRKLCVSLLLQVEVSEAVVVLQAAHESPQVPEEVLVRVTGLVLENLPALLSTQEWADFEKAHPSVVKSLKASKAYLSSGGAKGLLAPSKSELHLQ